MWNTQPFEKKMQDALVCEFGSEQGQKWFSKYIEARTYLIDNVYEQIRGTEPNMSDHGARHIANVLSNVNDILKDSETEFDAINLYCLGLIVLFHDVGNIKGRDGHNHKIVDVYNQVRSKKPEFNQEKMCVISAGRAHTGFSLDKTTDTLKEVSEIDHIDGKKIHLRELAAILRLADECAEGSQRTSDYMNKTNSYNQANQIYHDYAAITNIFIDGGGERIVLAYYLEVSSESLESGYSQKMLDFILKRIIKLDIERRYCKHYTQKLYRFKKTEATINLVIDGDPIRRSIGPIVLEDRFPLPLSDSEIDLSELLKQTGARDMANLMEVVQSKIKSVHEQEN